MPTLKECVIDARNHGIHDTFREHLERHRQLSNLRKDMRLLQLLTSPGRTPDSDAWDKRVRKGHPKTGY